jgi:zinc protease
VKRNFFVLALLVSFSVQLVAAPVGLRTRLSSNAVAAARIAPVAPVPQGSIVDRKLKNGLDIVILEDHSVPIVTIELAVKNGSYTEPPELNGLSHLYEHMFFKANRAVANQEDYLKTIGQMGIAYNGQTETEIVEYYFTTTSQNFPVAMKFMKDASRYPLFDKGEFEREREVVIGEINEKESNPYYFMNKAMNDRLFYKYPSRKNPLGNRETVASATTDIMRMIQARYYVPNNSALVITGDVRPEEVFSRADELFGDWTPTEDPFVQYPLVEHPALPKSDATIITQPVQNVVINLGWQGPSIGKDNAATYAADVFSFILTQPDSHFQRALVDTGVAANVGIGYLTQRNVGPINIIIQTSPDRAHAAVAAVYSEISHFNDTTYYTDEQLESAKALLAADDLYSREKLSEYAHTLSFWWASTGLEYFRGYQGNLQRTSRADISRYVTNYILGKPHVGLALISEDAQRQVQLKPVELVGQ